MSDHSQILTHPGWLADSPNSGHAPLRELVSEPADIEEALSFGRGLFNGLLASAFLWFVLIATIIL